MNKDSGITVSTLKVDGGMTSNSLLMQLQADLVGITVGLYSYIYFGAECHCQRAIVVHLLQTLRRSTDVAKQEAKVIWQRLHECTAHS